MRATRLRRRATYISTLTTSSPMPPYSCPHARNLLTELAFSAAKSAGRVGKPFCAIVLTSYVTSGWMTAPDANRYRPSLLVST
ncbi:hypothetical protein DENSPDRAFT_528042 [Dentipellis sp. KUC8613]|nr:hypothetical protein DENSPDRAFT_528042 [Dentipellis sp. KUC8613]